MSKLIKDSDDYQCKKKESFILRNARLRDEFLCPITCELLREPVVGSDGHTYEKESIEKWLKAKTISPRSGEPMLTTLVPNLNLKKLIQDMIVEVWFLFANI